MKKRWLRIATGLVKLFLIGIVVMLAVPMRSQTPKPTTNPVVLSEVVYVKCGFGENFGVHETASKMGTVVAKVNCGDVLTSFGEANDFYKVRTEQGFIGYIPSEFISKTPQAASVSLPPSPTTTSVRDSKNAASAAPSSKVDEAETLSLIVAALRKGFDNEKEFCEVDKIAANECDTAFRQIITYTHVKLNPKGQEGLLVGMGRSFCGSGGCTTYLLKPATKGYEILIDGFNLEMSKTTNLGFYDVVQYGDFRDRNSAQTYTWDGSKYLMVSKAPIGQAAQAPVAASPAAQAANQKQWDIYI